MNIYLVRPWLDWRKQDLYNDLQQHSYTWREDASDASPKYLRNRNRNEFLPLLDDDLTNGNMEARLETLATREWPKVKNFDTTSNPVSKTYYFKK
jgi:tRNA(Ile)-lysidine synthase TilS/MesJ